IVAMLGALACGSVLAVVLAVVLAPVMAAAQGTRAPAAPVQAAPTQTTPRAPLSLAPSATDVKQREQELEKLRAEQRKAQENEATLKREIEALGDDRRKFNQQIIET